MPSRAGESGKRASSDRGLAPETERRTDTGRGIGTGTVTIIDTVSTSRKATNVIAAAVQRGPRTRSAAGSIADLSGGKKRTLITMGRCHTPSAG